MKKPIFFILLILLSCAVRDEQRTKEWQYYYDMGMSSYVAKNYSDAIANFFRATQIAPKEPKVWNALGLAYTEAKEFQKAESSFQKALEIDPAYTEAKMNLGILYYKAKDYTKAKNILEDALKDETFSQKHMAYYYLAKVYKALGEDNKYLENLEKATAYNPLFLEAQMELAEEYERRGEYEKAKYVYTTLLNNNVDIPLVSLSLARVNFELGNYEESKSIIKSILERKDSDNFVKSQAYSLLNKILIAQQERYIRSLHKGAEEKPEEEQKPTPALQSVKEVQPPVQEKVYAIQLGSFSSYERADAFKKKLEGSLKDVRVVEQSGIYKVIYGRFTSREEAEKKQRDLLKNFNILGFIVEQ
ncbi:SPOR domain-containing protein [Hydrogenobacter thermophilus]|uniref:SPOR domain-containing protein n=1 Tax=Hydrogenobacter thermophilus TaxID=940 RepID=UPI0030F8BF54